MAVKPVAGVLRDYQLDGGYTPGPLYAAGLAAGLLGSLCGLARRRTLASRGPGQPRAADSELAVACLLVTLSAVVLLLSSDAYEFSWRYQLPAVVMLPVAGALGLTALAGRISPARASRQALTAVPTSTGGQVDELVPHLRRQVLGASRPVRLMVRRRPSRCAAPTG